MTFEGVLGQKGLAEILQRVGQERKTGILTVQGERDIVAISFYEGRVVAADALNQTVEEGLREVLVGGGLVKQEEFAALSSEHQAGGGRVIDLLVERSYLNRNQLLDALRLQTYRLVLQVLHWCDGDYKFYSGEEVFYEEGFIPIPMEELFIRALRDLGPNGPLPGHPPDSRTVYQWTDGTQVSRLDLKPAERGALELIDGRRPVFRLVEESALSEYELLYLIYRLEQEGRVRARSKPPAPAPESVAQPPVEIAPPGARAAPEEVRRRRFVPREVEVPRVEEAPSPALDWVPWLSRGLALALGAALVVVTMLAPSYLLYPFPWERPQRVAFTQGRRDALFLKILRGTESFYLIEGRFPDRLEALLELGLLAERDLLDPSGRALAFSSSETSYVVQPLEEGQPIAGAGRTESISGNILLDPEFLSLPDMAEEPPLVLLD